MACTAEICFNIFPHCALQLAKLDVAQQKVVSCAEVCELRHAATAGLLHWLFRGHQRPERNWVMG